MEPIVIPEPPTLSGTRFLTHPLGLGTLFFTEMWERFTYYGMRALLVLFMTAAASAGGLGMTPQRAGAVYGLFTAGVYLFSLPGGWVADRLIGPRRSVFWGGVLIAGGNLLVALPGGMSAFYCGLFVITMGVGLLKPNVSVMVGQLYDGESDARRDSAFSIFYFGIYLGAFIAPLIAGTIGEIFGYRWGFLTASAAMMIGTVQYVVTRGWLGAVGLHPHATGAQLRANWIGFGICAALFGALIALFADGLIPITITQAASLLGTGMGALAVVFFGYVLFRGGLTDAERKRVLLIVILFLCGALFPAGLEQAGSTMNLFARDFTDRSLFGSHFAGGQHPVSWYQSIEPVFVLILAPMFAWAWTVLGRRHLDPSTPVKFGISLLALGASFAVMMFAAEFIIKTNAKAVPGWLIATYFLQAFGELCISPVGLSSITKLAPRRYVSQMMGMWFLGAAIGSLIAGLMGGDIGGGSVQQMPDLFLVMAIIGGMAGLLMVIVSRPLQRLATFGKSS